MEEEEELVIDLKENLKLWNCAHCPKTFVQACNYKTHLKAHGLNINQLYICPICGRDFAYKNSLAVHLGTLEIEIDLLGPCPPACPMKIASNTRRHFKYYYFLIDMQMP